MDGGFGDGNGEADVPGSVEVGGGEAVVVDYETADGDACCAVGDVSMVDMACVRGI